MFSGLQTYNSFSPSQLIDIDINNDISVNLTDINLNILSSDLLCLDLKRKYRYSSSASSTNRKSP